MRQPYCKPCAVAYHREWRATQGGREKMRAGVAASKARYPEKQKARNELAYAVRMARVIPGPCYAIGYECAGKIEGHHDDYSKPLEVTWTCRAHHRALDRQRHGAA